MKVSMIGVYGNEPNLVMLQKNVGWQCSKNDCVGDILKISKETIEHVFYEHLGKLTER